MNSIVDRWNTAYFDNRLSPGAVAALKGLVEASADAQTLADRVFRLMRVARFGPAATARSEAGVRCTAGRCVSHGICAVNRGGP